MTPEGARAAAGWYVGQAACDGATALAATARVGKFTWETVTVTVPRTTQSALDALCARVAQRQAVAA